MDDTVTACLVVRRARCEGLGREPEPEPEARGFLGFERFCGAGRLHEEVLIPPGVAIWILEYAASAAAEKRDPVRLPTSELWLCDGPPSPWHILIPLLLRISLALFRGSLKSVFVPEFDPELMKTRWICLFVLSKFESVIWI